jgi:hypothetical protein
MSTSEEKQRMPDSAVNQRFYPQMNSDYRRLYERVFFHLRLSAQLCGSKLLKEMLPQRLLF